MDVLSFGRGRRDKIYPSRDHKIYVEGRSDMTNEEAERTMQFILEHLAQTAVNVELTSERLDGITIKVDQLTDRVQQISEKVDKLAGAQLKYEARAGRLEESFLILVKLAQSADERMDKSNERMDVFDEKMNKFSDGINQFGNKMNEFGDKMIVLVDAQIRTDENIRNLMTVVDRYYSEGRNGKT